MGQQVWFITGCSSGVGKSLAHAALAKGDRVIATARGSVDRLKELQQAGAAVLELDVTGDRSDLKSTADKAIAMYGHVDVVVPNAGYSDPGVTETLTPERWQKQFAVNFFGVINVVESFLPHFRERKAGVIAYSSSVYAHAMSPGAAPYAASKHAVAAYAKTLAVETAAFGIKSILFDIGFIRNSFLDKVEMHEMNIPDYQPVMDQLNGMVGSMLGKQPIDEDKCANAMVDAVKSVEGPLSIIPIGSDATATVRKYAAVLNEAANKWEDLSRSVDRDEPRQGAFAIYDHYWLL